MKKILCTALCGILLFTLTGCNVRFAVGKNSESAEDVEINKSIDLENAKSINIVTGYGETKISSYDGAEVKIVGKLGKNSQRINYSVVDGKLNIKEEGNNTISFFKIQNDKGSNYEILIPKTFNGDLEMENGAGVSTVSNLMMDNFKIKQGVGELNISDIAFEKLDITAGAGKLDMKLNKKCGDININGGIGEVTLDMKEVGGNLSYKGGVGDGKIKIPKNSPVRFNTSSGIGDCNITAKTSNIGAYTFDLQVEVGQIEVYN